MLQSMASSVGMKPGEDFQGHERERKFDRSPLSARISFDVVCLRDRDTSSKVGRSLGFLNMHCLPNLHARLVQRKASPHNESAIQALMRCSQCTSVYRPPTEHAYATTISRSILLVCRGQPAALGIKTTVDL